MLALPLCLNFELHRDTLDRRSRILRNKPLLVAPFYDEYVCIWFYLSLRTVTQYANNRIGCRRVPQSGPRLSDAAIFHRTVVRNGWTKDEYHLDGMFWEWDKDGVQGQCALLPWFPEATDVWSVPSTPSSTQIQNPACGFSKTSHRIASD